MSARLTSAVEGIRGLDRDSEQAEENEDGALAARSSAHPAAWTLARSHCSARQAPSPWGRPSFVASAPSRRP